jgi:hypothetical protein
MGLVSVAANWPYLLGTTGEERWVAWIAAGCGAGAIAVGAWLLIGPRRRGSPMVLTRRQWRYGFAAVMATVCAALLVAALSAPQPQVMTGGSSLLVLNFLLQLFVAEGSEKDEAVAFSEAQRRTWWRGIASLFATGIVAIGAAVALAVAGNALASAFLMLFGMLFLVLTATMRRQLARRQREAPRKAH